MSPVERLTAADAEVRQRQVAGALRRRGLVEGDRVGVVAESSAALLVVVLAALRRGIVPVVLSPALLPVEQDLLLEDAEPRLVLRDADLPALADGPPADLAPVPLARPMHYTSGTTGRPKGVWSGVLAEREAVALVEEERALWGFDAADRHLVVSPLHHSAPIRFSAGTLLAGGEVLVPGRFDAARLWTAIDDHRPTSTFVVPTHLHRLLDDGRLGHEALRRRLASFRLVAHAGAPCPEPLKRRAIGVLGAGALWEFYGSTEGQFTACSSDEWLAHPGTVGRARPGRSLAVDPDGTIWCEVPAHARFSYWRDPERTAQAWRGDAFSVGDLGRLDEGGRLWLDGRRDDLIISGGVNVYPAEVEAVLRTLPGVHDVAVFALAHDDWGQQVCAAVVGDVDPEVLRLAAGERLAPHKRPKQVHPVDELPRTATGKVRRLDLAARFGG